MWGSIREIFKATMFEGALQLHWYMYSLTKAGAPWRCYDELSGSCDGDEVIQPHSGSESIFPNRLIRSKKRRSEDINFLHTILCVLGIFR